MTSRANMKEDFYTMEFIVNDIVFVSFKKDLKSIGINYNEGYFKIKGHDNLGLWLEHPGIENIKDVDENGKPIPNDKRKKEIIEGVFLMLWVNIITILHFPNRDGFDFPGRLDHGKIGFESKK